MREIKFRAWDGKRLYFPEQFINDSGGLEVGYFDPSGCPKGCYGYPLMQYTGMKDRTGREIYEGDILVHDMAAYRGEVKYFEGGYTVGEPISANCLIHYNTVKYALIIGNIYENPELLEEK